MRNYNEQGLKAHRLAELIHGHQVDKTGEPYMGHVTRVASAAMRHAPVHSAMGQKLYIVGLLHDTVEDTDGRELSPEEVKVVILEHQGEEIAQAVEAMTHDHWKSEPYADYIERVKANTLATEVKLEDLRDNFNPDRALKLAVINDEQFTRVVDVLIPRYIRAYDYLTH